jgi:SpoVK/Ycf46/Vps4 family AAA+-type ATPase
VPTDLNSLYKPFRLFNIEREIQLFGGLLLPWIICPLCVCDVNEIIEELAKITVGFSGEEITAICLRTLLDAIGEFFDHNEKIILKPNNFEATLEEIEQERKNKKHSKGNT